MNYRVASGVGNTYLTGIQASFQIWEDDPDSYIDFEYNPTLVTGPPSSFNEDSVMNGFNEVGWLSITDGYPGAIAGHWLLLGDLYNETTRNETMFAYGLKKPGIR